MLVIYVALAISIVLRAWGRFKIDSSIADRIKKNVSQETLKTRVPRLTLGATAIALSFYFSISKRVNKVNKSSYNCGRENIPNS